MSRAPTRTKPRERAIVVTESLPAGYAVRGAGEQLARLIGAEVLARLRVRTPSAPHEKGAMA